MQRIISTYVKMCLEKGFDIFYEHFLYSLMENQVSIFSTEE